MPTNNYCILCVEDDKDSFEMFKVLIESTIQGCKVSGAGSVEEARQTIAEGIFDLYLVDLYLPDSDGIEIIQQISKWDTSVPILVYTGSILPSDRQEALDAGADEFLTKPNDFDKLLPTLTKLLKEKEPRFGTAARQP